MTSNPCYGSDIMTDGRLSWMKAKHAGRCWARPEVRSLHWLSLAGSIVKLERRWPGGEARRVHDAW